MKAEQYLNILKSEIRPALGCTEPIAVALAVARAREELGCLPDTVELCVSKNILKNAMGVGIPGTSMVGLEIASALSCLIGKSSYNLEVLKDATHGDYALAKGMVKSGLIHVSVKDTDKKLFIEAKLTKGDHHAVCIIEDSHTRIRMVMLDGIVIVSNAAKTDDLNGSDVQQIDIAGIYNFIIAVELHHIEFLREGNIMNDAIAQEGLNNKYGMCVGRTLQSGRKMDEMSLCEYVSSYTAAAADARMDCCTLPVMSTAGSGNQGITASLPVLAAARKLDLDEVSTLRAEALSQLVTIHIRKYIGRLSPLCGCAVASSIGAACGIVFLLGGNLEHIGYAIKNMISDFAGIICDGAKPSCALKIASSISCAVQCAQLALAGICASSLDGIVSQDVEATISNLGILATKGMKDADNVILGMMLNKRNKE